MTENKTKFDLFKWMVSDTQRRRRYISECLRMGQQNVHTPFSLCSEMIGKLKENLEKEGKNIKEQQIFVVCNVEFVEVLVHDFNVSAANIEFFADSKAEAAFTRRIYNVRTAYVGDSGGKTLLENLDTAWKMNMKKEKPLQVVIMNPPYQVQSGDSPQAKPIYHKFIEKVVDDLNPDYLLSINPSRWMAGGMGLDDFRKRMMKDRRIKNIVHFPGTKEVFPSVSIGGGVNYFLWAKSFSGDCEFVVEDISVKRDLRKYDIIVQDNNAILILEKTFEKNKKWVSEKVSSINPFLTQFSSSPDISKLLSSIQTKDATICYGAYKEIIYAQREAFRDKKGTINKWKVVVGKVMMEGANFKGNVKQYLKTPFIIEPSAICTETYIVVNAFETEEEAKNFITYMKTKYFRFMVSLRVSGQNISKDNFSWVPDIENYSKPWTDIELYAKFGLDSQEIAYIESKIKELK